MVWGRPKLNAGNGGWTDYSDGKGRGGDAAGGWGGRRDGSWYTKQRRGERGGKTASAISDVSPKDITPAILAA